MSFAGAETLPLCVLSHCPGLSGPLSPPQSVSWLIGQKAEEGGFRTWQKDGTAREEQAPMERKMEVVLLERDPGSGDPGRASATASPIPVGPPLGCWSSWMDYWEESQK